MSNAHYSSIDLVDCRFLLNYFVMQNKLLLYSVQKKKIYLYISVFQTFCLLSGVRIFSSDIFIDNRNENFYDVKFAGNKKNVSFLNSKRLMKCTYILFCCLLEIVDVNA